MICALDSWVLNVTAQNGQIWFEPVLAVDLLFGAANYIRGGTRLVLLGCPVE